MMKSLEMLDAAVKYYPQESVRKDFYEYLIGALSVVVSDEEFAKAIRTADECVVKYSEYRY